MRKKHWFAILGLVVVLVTLAIIATQTHIGNKPEPQPVRRDHIEKVKNAISKEQADKLAKRETSD